MTYNQSVRCKEWRASLTPEKKLELALKARLRTKQWRQVNGRNSEKENCTNAAKERKARWKKNNPHLVCKDAQDRHAQKLQAIPKWANHFFIEEAYALAKLREKTVGGKWHVDHIVPLRSEIVCGLHVEHNLRVIPAKENLQKGNRYWDDMP